MMNPPLRSTAMEVLLDWRSVSSLMATLMLLTSLIQTYIPSELRVLARRLFLHVFARVKPTATVLIDEYDPLTGSNDLYDAAQLYLGTHCLADSPSVRLFKPRNAAASAAVVASLPDSHTVNDIYQGVPMKWNSLKVEQSGSGGGRNNYHHLYPYSGGGGGGRGGGGGECRSLELVFHPRHRDMVHNCYIPHVIEEAARLRYKSRERKLYTNRPYAGVDDMHRLWSSHTFSHPSNFDTLAIDPELREEIRDDLLRFMSRKDHYNRVGRAWKRGYLLHGPPGTGKTSLVAAIANLLEFDIYDLELTTVPTNTQLRRLLVSTTSKSVVVIEDIDCSLDLTDRRKKSPDESQEKSPGKSNKYYHETISLSGVLNFVDGLWSSCVGERLMIFTTNHPERLDPALLRPGRMDRKIELGYLNKAAFRILARNYLCIENGEMDGKTAVAEIENLLEEVRVTPAEVAEVFMTCDGDSADAALQKLVAELHQKKSAQLLKPTPDESNPAASASEPPGCMLELITIPTN